MIELGSGEDGKREITSEHKQLWGVLLSGGAKKMEQQLDGDVLSKDFCIYFEWKKQEHVSMCGDGLEKGRETFDAEERGRIAREVSLWH